MKFKGAEEAYDFTLSSTVWLLLLFLVPFVAFSLAFFPLMIYLKFFFSLLRFHNLLHLVFFCFVVTMGYMVITFSSMCFTALFIRGLRIRYEEGDYRKSLKDPMFIKFALFYALYYPTYKLIDFLVFFPPLKSLYLLMLGCKLGTNVTIAFETIITDPLLTEIGSNTIIGARSLITAHLAENNLHIRRVKIGDNCLIGGETFIMPGVNIENNVIVAARSMVSKNKTLKQGRTYGGSPARDLNEQYGDTEQQLSPDV